MSTSAGRLEGYPIRFNSVSVDLGGFKEVIRPEATDRTLGSDADVFALAHHSSDKVLASRRANTLRLEKDGRGLLAVIDVADTSAGRDTVASVARRDLKAMSFGFRAVADVWSLDTDGYPRRDVTDMAISEISVVTWPAYVETSVAVRSLEWRAADRAIELSNDRNRGESCRAQIDLVKRLAKTPIACNRCGEKSGVVLETRGTQASVLCRRCSPAVDAPAAGRSIRTLKQLHKQHMAGTPWASLSRR